MTALFESGTSMLPSNMTTHVVKRLRHVLPIHQTADGSPSDGKMVRSACGIAESVVQAVSFAVTQNEHARIRTGSAQIGGHLTIFIGSSQESDPTAAGAQINGFFTDLIIGG